MRTSTSASRCSTTRDSTGRIPAARTICSPTSSEGSHRRWRSTAPPRGGFELSARSRGQTGSRFDNDASALRVGTQVTHGGFTLYAGASAGLSGAAEDYGVMGGVLYAFEVERLAALFD